MPRLLLACLLIVTLLPLTAAPLRADVTAAARAFSEGQAAQLDGDYDRAAQSFELAFAISPSKEALRSAIRARQLSKQLARAATLAELLAAQYASDPASLRLANDVIAEAKPRLGRMVITCAATCTVAVGGRAISIKPAELHVVYVTPGHQVLELTFEGGQSVARELDLEAGDDLSVPIERPRDASAPPVAAVTDPVPAPPVAPPPPSLPPRKRAPPVRHEDHRLSPLLAISGAVVTLGLTGAGIWSGLDTNRAHDDYVANPTAAGWSDGRSRQLRTNLLFGGAAVAGLGTAALAVFWTRWHGEERPPAVGLSSTAHGVAVTWAHPF